MSYFIFGVAILIGTLLLMGWASNAQPREILKSLRWIGLGAAVLLAVFLLATGRLSFIWWALMGLLPWIGRLRFMNRLWKAARGPKAGDSSSISTRFFDMTLDHDSGHMDGTVREGRFVGRKLSGLDEGERLDLAREVAREDAQSMRVLEAYLDRMHGSNWRAAFGGGDGDRGGRYEGGFGTEEGAGTGGSGSTGGTGEMGRSEAYRVLGLEEGASAAEIKRAHRQLMKVVHPDAGGSDYMASKVNEAKRVLLGK